MSRTKECDYCSNDHTSKCDECWTFFNGKRYHFSRRAMTHFDELKLMNEEELAGFIESIAPHDQFRYYLNGTSWLGWLRKEAED